ncbi:MAG: hypothetical protein WB992_25600, partial [Bryobacteraceae bacterium]
TTYFSALLLLLLSLICLGSWANTFKRAGTRWRFELFSFDFAIGAILLALIAAFTFGTLGSDLTFSDRLLVAGRAAQVWLIAAGVVFNLGNMLLIAATSLLGMSIAFPMSIGLALIEVSFFHFNAHNVFFLVGGIIFMTAAVLLDGMASQFRDLSAAKPPKTTHRSPHVRKMRKTTKGLIVALMSGILLGLFYPLAAKGMSGDLGVGPYGGALLFSVGILLSTPVYNLYFMNMAIEGGPISFNAYFTGRPQQHFLGFVGGALWILGALAALLAAASSQTGLALSVILPLASVILAIFWGTLTWKELSAAPKNAKLSIGLTAVFFICALICFGAGVAR